jgi:hypothetical protein
MAGLSQISKEPPKPKGEPCSVGTVIPKLDDEDRAYLIESLEDPHTPPSSALGRGLRERGFQVGDHSIRRHRRKECLCSWREKD